MLYGLIFANGDLEDGPAIRAALTTPGSRFVVAADGGLRNVLALDLVPDLVIGDFDSADPAMLVEVEKRGARLQRYPMDKDETDLELALLAAVQHGCDPIRVFAAVGDRLDQTLGNIYLLALPALRGREVRLVSGKQTAWLAYPGEIEITGEQGDTVSLIPLEGAATGVVTDKLKYPLRDETLVFGPARGMSNVLLETEAHVSFKGGVMLVVHTVGRA